MAILTEKVSLNYSDVHLLQTKPTKVKSRREIPIEGYRIVVSAMTSIIGPTFIEAVANLPNDLRPSLHIPRDVFLPENLELVEKFKLQEDVFIGVGVNLSEIELNDLENRGFRYLLLDIANGGLPQIPFLVKMIKKHNFQLCVGSVHTSEMRDYLVNMGVDIIRSGIAPGSACTTKDATGFTRGTFTEIYELTKDSKITVLADGGFSKVSDVVKSFLAGANFIMSGSLFKEAHECRMHCNGESKLPKPYKGESHLPTGMYYGQASYWGKISMGAPLNFIEGTQYGVSPTQSLEEVLTKLWEGIRSGVSYSGFTKLKHAIGQGVFEIKY